jgi:hypothetical protein
MGSGRGRVSDVWVGRGRVSDVWIEKEERYLMCWRMSKGI